MKLNNSEWMTAFYIPVSEDFQMYAQWNANELLDLNSDNVRIIVFWYYLTAKRAHKPTPLMHTKQSKDDVLINVIE